MSNHAYRLPLTLTALLQVDLINVAYLMACAIIRSSYISLHFLNDVVNDVKSTRKLIKNDVMIASLEKERTCKLINRIPGSPLLMSSLPGSAFRMHVESLGKSRNSTLSVLEALPGKLDIKRHSPKLPQNALKRDRNSKCIDLIEGHYLEVVVLL